MIDWAEVTPILVTRGDVGLTEIIATLPFSHVVIWNNGDGSRADLAVYGRYAAIEEVPDSQAIYVQDDDVILAPESFDALLAAYEPGKLVANMPGRFREYYPDSCLVGFGALFGSHLPSIAHAQFHESMVEDASHWTTEGQARFFRTCDVIFTALTERKLIDVPYTDRPFASDAMRMWKQPGHFAERQRMLELARRVRDETAVTS